MTRLCIAGGTGQIGRLLARFAVEQGHQVTVFSRNPPVGPADGVRYLRADATTGEGLAEALGGSDVVIDCLEGRSGKALQQYADAGARLLAAAATAGVQRAVALSIINCDASRAAFYASKAAKERVYAASGVETLTVRASQFHSLLAAVFAAGAKVGLVPVIKGSRFQTISPVEVARALLAEAVAPFPEPAGQRHRIVTIAGPEIRTMRELAENWRRITGRKGFIVEVPLPGAMGDYLRKGLNLAPESRHGTETFESWLAKTPDSL
ncbi:SDR family oxidoreductase [Arthrobacter silvisoli]|uniref:SDR family oxidoreductase n=1 Tax=Arthrobacter silvisoli TaxID=2291022 RepID=UPI000E212AAB|nr:NAD(P)H-binding protein [Arthrobacter silvisoli]